LVEHILTSGSKGVVLWHRNHFSQPKSTIMKTLFAFLAIAMTFMSCQKEDSALAATGSTLSNEEAAAVVQYALAGETNGMSTFIKDVASKTVTVNNPYYCGLSKDSTFSKSGTTYAYSAQLSWLLTCTPAKVPASLQFSLSTSGQYQVAKVSSKDAGTGTATFSGLEVKSSNYVVNAEYVRNGAQTLNVATTKSVTSNLSISMSNLQVNKSTYQILSGTGTFNLSGKTLTGKTFSYTGTIVFNGNCTAIITTNGKSFTISIC
jgi:hypothetical protein